MGPVSDEGRSIEAAMPAGLSSEADEKLAPLLSAVIETEPRPLLVLNDCLEVQHANSAFLDAFGATLPDIEGRPLFALDRGRWDIPELRQLLGNVLSEREEVCNFRIPHRLEPGSESVMILNAKRIEAEKQRHIMILLATDDVKRHEGAEDQVKACAVCPALMESVREALIILSPELKVIKANNPFYRTFEIRPSDAEGTLIYKLANGQWDIPELRRLLEVILPEKHFFEDYEITCDFKHIGKRVIMLNGRRLERAPLIVLAIRDVTESRRHETSQKALVGELQHRVKNLLSNVLALAHQLYERSMSLEEFFEGFEDRLFSLARTQELLVSGPSNNVKLRRLVRGEFQALAATEGVDFQLTGPSIVLSPRSAHTLGMVLHELGINAAKHGALSVKKGMINVTWSEFELEGRAQIEFLWREHGVTKPVQGIGRIGFGTEVLQEIAPYMLDGSACLSMQSDGIQYRLTFPVERN